MRKVIVQELVSVDGFVAGPSGELDFFESVADYSEIDADNIELLETVDAVLLGRKTYEMLVEYWPTAEEPMAPAVNTTPKIVFSSTIDGAPWGEWEPAQVRRGRAADEVAAMRGEPGKDMIVWGSVSLAQSLFQAGLVDEIQLRVVPVAIGNGRPLLSEQVGRVNLHLAEAKPYRSGIVSLRYTVTDR